MQVHVHLSPGLVKVIHTPRYPIAPQHSKGEHVSTPDVNIAMTLYNANHADTLILLPCLISTRAPGLISGMSLPMALPTQVLLNILTPHNGPLQTQNLLHLEAYRHYREAADPSQLQTYPLPCLMKMALISSRNERGPQRIIPFLILAIPFPLKIRHYCLILLCNL